MNNLPQSIQEALTKPRGAVFYRCSLQVNPFDYGNKYRGDAVAQEEHTYNEAIGETCLSNHIQVVGIADHGSVERLDTLRNALEAKGIVVFPGFEIASAEKIHMVCLYAPGTSALALSGYLGSLMGSNHNPEKQTDPSTLGCIDIARLIKQQGGVWYAAHVTGKSGILRLTGDGDNHVNVWRDEESFHAVQIPGKLEDITGENHLEKYQAILENRNPNYRRERPVAILNAKDVKNKEGLAHPSASCRIKMTEPTIEALKQAFLDPESRIRLNHEETPQPPAYLIAAAWEGGFLDGVQLHFGENLNTLIGGRGAGKSTVVETLRYALDIAPKGEDAKRQHLNMVKDNLGANGRIQVWVSSSSQMGQCFVVRRQWGAPPEVLDKNGVLSRLTPRDLLGKLEVLGQNEILEIAKDEGLQWTLLSRFLPSRKNDSPQFLKRLADNRGKLLKAMAARDELAADVARLPKLHEQVERFKSLGLEHKLAASGKLSRENQLWQRATEDRLAIVSAISALQTASDLDLAYLSPEATKDLPNNAIFTQLHAKYQSLSQDLLLLLDQAGNRQETFAQEYVNLHEAWRAGKSTVEDTLRAALSDLPGLAGKSGTEVGSEYVRLLHDIEAIQPLQKKLQAQDQLVETLKVERFILLSEWNEAQFQRFFEMEQTVKEINRQKLNGKLRITLTRGGIRKPLKDFLLQLEGIGAKKTEWVDDASLTIADLVKAIYEGREALEKRYQLDGMPASVAGTLAGLSPEHLLLLHELELGDKVMIELNVGHEGASGQFRPLEKLSTGQKCTAILHLLLLDNDEPLIIDQPEDNLDNAFIAERIVRELRTAKQKRQFLFATHNANIPVFGDAEWIGVLEADSGQASIRDQHIGSIDKPELQVAVENILEGGKNAFETRRLKYGF